MSQTPTSPGSSSVAQIAPAPVRWRLLLSLLAAIGAAAPAEAQDTLPRLEIGTRVKLEPWTHASDPVTGIVVRSTPDTIGLSLRSGYRYVPRSEIFRVRVSDGRSRSSGAKKGAQWGALAMLVLGITATAAVSSSPEDQSSHELAPLEVVSGVVALGAAGALVGALVGSLVRAEHWRTAWTARQP